MSENNQEQLSCLMDGELDRNTTRFLLRRLAADVGMRDAWRRYHVVRACLHGDRVATGDLSGRVAAALTDEAGSPALNRTLTTWLKPIAGSAIAASVAVLAVIGINQNLLERQTPAASVEQTGFVSQGTTLDRTFTRPAVPVSYSAETGSNRHRLNTYVLRHNQAAGGAGFVSYVPIVTSQPILPPEAPEETAPARQAQSPVQER